jgi:hypothetical protein
MPGARPDDPPPAPNPAGVALDRDVYCPGCRYNLRGLTGDPLRCPECGRASTRADLFPAADQAAARFQELRQTLDALVVGLLIALPTVVGLGVSRPLGFAWFAVAAGLVLLVAVVLVGAVLEVRHLTTHPDWARALAGYLASSVLLLVALPVVWALGMGLLWGILWLWGPREHTAWWSLPGGLLAVVLVLAHGRLIPALRRRQTRQFERLVRFARATPRSHPSRAD